MQRSCAARILSEGVLYGSLPRLSDSIGLYVFFSDVIGCDPGHNSLVNPCDDGLADDVQVLLGGVVG